MNLCFHDTVPTNNCADLKPRIFIKLVRHGNQGDGNEAVGIYIYCFVKSLLFCFVSEFSHDTFAITVRLPITRDSESQSVSESDSKLRLKLPSLFDSDSCLRFRIPTHETIRLRLQTPIPTSQRIWHQILTQNSFSRRFRFWLRLWIRNWKIYKPFRLQLPTPSTAFEPIRQFLRLRLQKLIKQDSDSGLRFQFLDFLTTTPTPTPKVEKYRSFWLRLPTPFPAFEPKFELYCSFLCDSCKREPKGCYCSLYSTRTSESDSDSRIWLQNLFDSDCRHWFWFLKVFDYESEKIKLSLILTPTPTLEPINSDYRHRLRFLNVFDSDSNFRSEKSHLSFWLRLRLRLQLQN